MVSPPPFEIQPMSLADVDAMLDIEERAFASNPISQAASAPLTTAETRAVARAWKRMRMSNALEGRGDSNADRHWRKVVYRPADGSAAQVVAVACWCAPAANATKPALESRPMVPAIEDAPVENRDARVLMRRLHDTLVGGWSEALMGGDRDSHYWYLDALATLPEFQQRGLGSMLVRWGIEQAKVDAKARPGRIKGVWTIATPMGLRTYLKAGMQEIGSEIFDFGKGGGENGQKYVWLLIKFDE
ncbi:hypothetical protein MMC26_001789 [Xylographa opegraphella]|nr:hypothetical protein [Xylographa opegraphella]